ncbi:MAG: hypothetical protein QOH74_578, partial [Gaiellales bacterium]|nr:hypothetical protein [Gaiellales bacterium]
MLRSLRTRLALLFAGTLLLATVIAGAASIRLYQSYNRDQTASELRSQAGGVAAYYAKAVVESYGGGSKAPSTVTAGQFQDICGCRLYYDGAFPLFPEVPKNLANAGVGANTNWESLNPADRRTFEFRPPGDDRTFIGIAAPVVPSLSKGEPGQAIGA